MTRRSSWRRVARPARWILHRGANLIDPLVHPDPAGLLPPAHLRIYYYGSWAPELVARAGENARIELTSRGLRPEHRVLDIGSGIGNLALALKDHFSGGYDGLEIHPEAAGWQLWQAGRKLFATFPHGRRPAPRLTLTQPPG